MRRQYSDPLHARVVVKRFGCGDLAAAAMPTAEAVWARVRSAAVNGSALYAGLAASVLCAVATVLRTQPQTRLGRVGFCRGLCDRARVYARAPGTALERVSLGVPAAALVVVGVSAPSAERLRWHGPVSPHCSP